MGGGRWLGDPEGQRRHDDVQPRVPFVGKSDLRENAAAAAAAAAAAGRSRSRSHDKNTQKRWRVDGDQEEEEDDDDDDAGGGGAAAGGVAGRWERESRRKKSSAADTLEEKSATKPTDYHLGRNLPSAAEPSRPPPAVHWLLLDRLPRSACRAARHRFLSLSLLVDAEVDPLRPSLFALLSRSSRRRRNERNRDERRQARPSSPTERRRKRADEWMDGWMDG